MAIYDVQYIKQSTTGLPEDNVVNVLHFQTNEAVAQASTASDLAGHVAASHFDAAVGANPKLEFLIANSISRVNKPIIKVFDAILPGSALAQATQAAMGAAMNAQDFPSEVACCLSFRADYGSVLEEAADDADPDSAPERPRSRIRGRIFEGPFVTGAGAGSGISRPTADLQNCLLNYATRLAGVGALGSMAGKDAKWVVLSREAGGVAFPVAHAWVDNAFDTQRRRGVAASSRLTQTITQ